MAEAATCSLTALNLSANAAVMAAGAIALAHALPRSTLLELGLAGCELGDSPCSRLSAFIVPSRLRKLDLAHNRLTCTAAWDLAWALSSEGVTPPQPPPQPYPRLPPLPPPLAPTLPPPLPPSP